MKVKLNIEPTFRYNIINFIIHHLKLDITKMFANIIYNKQYLTGNCKPFKTELAKHGRRR